LEDWWRKKIATALGVSKDDVHRGWKEAGLEPHRPERYMASDDPDFETKALTLSGCTYTLFQHAGVFCIDEKTANPGCKSLRLSSNPGGRQGKYPKALEFRLREIDFA
jgi:hypothetical protein